MKKKGIYILWSSLMILIYGCNSTKHIGDDEYLLHKVKVEINGEINSDKIDAIIKQQPNRKSLGVFRFHLWVYNLFDLDKVEAKIARKENRLLLKNERRVRKNKPLKLYSPTMGERIMEIVGEEPVIYDDILTNKSTHNINQYLINTGYFNGGCIDSVSFNKRKATTYYKIDTKRPYKIYKIAYRCYDMDVKAHIDTISRERLIKPADIYNTDILEKERDRISLEMKNRGYYYFNKEYVYMEVDSNLNKHKVNLKIITQNPQSTDSIPMETRHTQYKINDIYVHTNYNPHRANKMTEEDTVFADGIYYIYTKKLPLRDETLAKNIFLKRGDYYKVSNVSDTHRRLSSTRTFKYIKIDFTDLKNNQSLLDAHIYLSSASKMSLTLQTEGTHQDGYLGVAANLSYRNKNTFRGAEIFEAKFNGGLEAQRTVINDSTNSDIQRYIPFNTLEIMPEMSLYIPGIWIPFLKHPFRKIVNPSTKITAAYSHQTRPDYIRDIAKITYGYTGNSSPRHSHVFYPVDINYVNIANQDVFQEFLDNSNNSYLQNTYRDHLIVGSKYSFTYNNQDLSNPNRNYTYFAFNIEGSGNLLTAIGDMASFNQTNGSYTINDVAYAQYIKPEIDVRKYYRLGKVFNKHDSWIIYRLFTGVGIPLRNLQVLPFEKSYYGGGANGIRAWEARSLGPGSLNEMDAISVDQIADMRIEANIEYRFEIIEMLEAALFLDAGNIWLSNPIEPIEGTDFQFNRFYKEIAVGIGGGARINLDILIVRLDVGLPIHNPALYEGERWIFEPKINTNYRRQEKYGVSYERYRSKPVLSIGIGYPF